MILLIEITVRTGGDAGMSHCVVSLIELFAARLRFTPAPTSRVHCGRVFGYHHQALAHPRISIDPTVMMGKPCIKGTRLTVELLLRKLGAGRSLPTCSSPIRN